MSLEVDVRVGERDVQADFEVGAGETVAVLGPNGAGKSTVLDVVAGLLRPDVGRVALDGRELTGRRFVPPHDRRIALLAQDPLLFPHLSVLDNVAFGPRSRGARRTPARARAREWLDHVGLAELADRRPGSLSGGQAQRVALARALAAEPDVLLLDEPMAALDVAVRPGLRQTLRSLLADRTVLLVTHDVLDALLLADRVLVLDGGRVVEHGPTAEVLERPRSAFSARLAGLNLVAGTWQGGAVRGTDGLVVHGLPGAVPPPPGAPAVAVFRPGAVSIFRSDPGGSPRNAFVVTVSEMEPLGDRIRVRAGHLAADVTPRAAADLDLAPGVEVTFAVKATEVRVHPTGR